MNTQHLLERFVRTLAPLLLVLAWSTAGAGTITGSAHDFSTKAWSGGRICVACHTPHKADTTTTDAPLWNHKNSTATYTMYSSATLNATGLAVGGRSKLCLSCHDGTVAVDNFGGVATPSTFITAANNLGNNLGDDHPVGFAYNTALATADGSLEDPATKTVTIGTGTTTKTGTIASVMLFAGKMECSTCHDVHNTFTVGAAGTGMVKISNAGSALCIACHKK
ncbi:MAG: hypothetical protein JNK22_11130 [Rhodocyclaceae bacterium]|nr:hypothetical protein [Rhodocyclaceae bacterium]